MNKTQNKQNIDLCGISFKGTIPNCIDRVLKAVCQLIEALIDWLIWKLEKSKQK